MNTAPANMKFPRRWALAAAGILLTHTSLMILAVTIFVRHHDNGVIPDYYEKAVHWDETKAQQAKQAAAQNGQGGTR